MELAKTSECRSGPGTSITALQCIPSKTRRQWWRCQRLSVTSASCLCLRGHSKPESIPAENLWLRKKRRDERKKPGIWRKVYKITAAWFLRRLLGFAFREAFKAEQVCAFLMPETDLLTPEGPEVNSELRLPSAVRRTGLCLSVLSQLLFFFWNSGFHV